MSKKNVNNSQKYPYIRIFAIVVLGNDGVCGCRQGMRPVSKPEEGDR